MADSFSGVTASYYARYRRGYPDQVINAVVDRLQLDANDKVVDLGCGTGLLTAPLARRVRTVVALDPEPAMLAEARRLVDPVTGSRILWVLGSDADLPTVAALGGAGGWGAVTIGQALHFMDYQTLFGRAREMLRPGGGLAIISNGIPLWQQDRDWSRSLRSALEAWFQTRLRSTCGTADADRARYRSALYDAGFGIEEISYEYEAEMTFDDVIGALLSAISPSDVPDSQRRAFTEHIAQTLPTGSFLEDVPVTALIGVVS